MIVDSIRFDRVEIFNVEIGPQCFLGCLVSLRDNGSVSIQYSGNISSSRILEEPIVMINWEVKEFNPWELKFSAEMAIGNKINRVDVLCEFNLFAANEMCDLLKDEQCISRMKTQKVK